MLETVRLGCVVASVFRRLLLTAVISLPEMSSNRSV